MVVGEDEWRGNVRHVHEVAVLRDVSIVTRPAYEAAQVEYRSAPDPNPATGQEETTMATEADNTQDTTTNTDKNRGLEIRDTGSLRVQEHNDRPLFQSLADLYEQRGYFTSGAASVTWDEFRSFTWSAGTVLTDVNPIRREGVGLGYDRRWIYPAFPSTSVDAATTSVQYLRQSARTLAGTAVIRALDATSTKPETSSTAEYVTLQLSQVASVQTGIPRIHTAQPLFQSLVEQDLRLSINDGLDTLAIRGIQLAGTLAGKSGTLLVDVRKCMTGLQTAGYAPDTLLIDPPGAEALDLLQSYGTEKFWRFGAGRFAPGDVFGLNIRVGKNAGTAVLDANAYGRMYMSPVELRAFEADGGVTNQTNVRMELNAAFGAERLPPPPGSSECLRRPQGRPTFEDWPNATSWLRARSSGIWARRRTVISERRLLRRSRYSASFAASTPAPQSYGHTSPSTRRGAQTASRTSPDPWPSDWIGAPRQPRTARDRRSCE
jgi:hypothetical protein